MVRAPEHDASHQNGFVLISAMWLLLLGAAIAALLMLHAMTASRDLREDADRFGQEHSEADAIETIAADLIFSGRTSSWSQLPSIGSVTLDGRTIGAKVTDEERLADVNKASPARIDAALQDHGYDGAMRTALVGRVAMARASHRRIASYAELVALAKGIVPDGREDCLLDALSPFGGSGETAPILSASVRPGSVVRISFGENAHRHVQTLRLVAANDRPYALLDDYDATCAKVGGA